MAASTPAATLTVPPTEPIGADFTFNVTFDNTSATDTGYGPFIDLVMPATGADGAGAAVDDGITFLSATYLGQPVTAIQLTFPAGGCVAHPYAEDTTHAPLQVCGTPGDTLVVLQLPFGSFAPAQPPATVVVNAHLSNQADLGTALTIRSRSGFQFGNDALDNPCCDPSLVSNPSTASASWPGSPVTPTLLTLKKTYLGPEDETATGPNYPRDYRIDVDIAPGQTITSLDVTDLMPNNEAFLSVVTSSPAGATIISTPVAGAAHNAPNNKLTLRFPSVTGNTTANDGDASVTFRFFVPLNDATPTPVIDAASGNDATSPNEASALGNWNPIDTRDTGGTGNAAVDGVGPEHILTDKSIAIQKNVAIVAGKDVGAASYSVGDTLEYTLQFQISDYFAFRNVILNDTFSDGQHLDPAFTPTFAVAGNGFTLPAAAINAANYTFAPNYLPDPAPNDGTTALQFRVSNELVTRGQPNGNWIGGCIPVAGTGGPVPNCTTTNDGATTATVVFRTIIQDTFTDSFPSGDPYVDSGDHLDNNVIIGGDVLAVSNLAPTGLTEEDTSGTTVNIVFGNLSKTIYAINGNTAYTTPVQVSPNDTVTYRIQYELASSDFENLSFVDNLPLPIFAATSITTFEPGFDGTGVAPVDGHYKLGPLDTYHSRPLAVSPGLATNATDNSVTFGYGTFNDPANQPSHIDILFTVLVKDLPFADGLFLTNQVHESDGSTNGAPHEADAIIQLQLTEPTLHIKKGVIGSDHAGATLSPPTAGPVTFSAPGSAGARWTGTLNSTNLAATPVDSNISGVDTNDLVSFAIVVENTGASQKGAFNVAITDTLPLGLIIPPAGSGLNMRVTYGDGSPVAFTGLTNGAGQGQDLFTTGIMLDDPTLAGACQVYNPTNGKNIIVITYDLQVDSSAPSGTVIPNTATITNYSSTETGPNFVPVDRPQDTATTTVASPSLTKALTGTSINTASNSNTQAVIGELATYTLTMVVPEGQTNGAQIVDTLDAGLAFVDVTGVSVSAGVTGAMPTASATPANTTIGATGHTITFSLGNITNSNTNNAVAETISITYRAVVLNVVGNQTGTLLNNAAALTWANGGPLTAAAANVTVIEPALTILKAASPTTGDAGDTITFNLTVANTGAGSTEANDVSLSDVVPAGMTYVAGSLSNISGPAATLNAVSAPTLSAAWATLAPGTTSIISFQATLNSNVTLAQVITNNATVQWTTIAGAPGTISTYNASSTERTGADGVGGALNDYAATNSANVTVNSAATTKSIVTTSEGHTSEAGVGTVGNPRLLAVGEIIRYRLAVQLPEGVATNIQIVDALPNPGLTFLNDGTARALFVSNGTGISSAVLGAIPAVACTNLNGNATTIATLTQAQVNCTLADANISTASASNNDTYNSGTAVRFKLGTLTNADNDADAEFVVIEFNALVDNNNASANIAGKTLTNNSRVFLNTTANGPTSNNIVATVVEPSIPFNAGTNNKTVSPATGDAGDIVTYTLVYTNATGATRTDAFDARILDAVPPGATLNIASITIVPSGTCTTPTPTNNSAGNNIDITISRVSPGCTITVTYTATLTTSVLPGQLLVNTANLTYTSLPGANGTTGNGTGTNTPGASGATNGERNGSGTAPNAYLGSDTATVTVFVPAPVKSLVSTSEANTTGSNLAVGEIARYRLLVRVAEGSSPAFQLRDNLPPGTTFLNDGTAKVALVSDDPGLTSSTLTGAGPLVVGNETTVNGITPSFTLPGGAITGGPFVDGTDPIFSLGDLTNTDSDANSEFVVVEFNALTSNVIGNQAGTALSNTFDVFINGGPSLATSNPVATNVVEPVINNLLKTVVATTGDAGDTVTYTLVYTNATGVNSADAYDARILDAVPSDATLNIASISVTGSAPCLSPPFTNASAGTNVDITLSRVAPGCKITITYTATLNSSVTPDQLIANTANLTYTSLPGLTGTSGNPTGSNTPGATGTSTGERNGAGAPLNDYTGSSTANVRVPKPTITKALVSTSDTNTTGNNVTIGELVNYDLTITLPEGTTPSLNVVDILPAGLVYVAGSAVIDTTGFNGTVPAPTITGGASDGDDVTASFGSISVTGDNVTTNNSFVIHLTTRVSDIAGNVGVNPPGQTSLSNSATVQVGAATPIATPAVLITVVEPRITTTKSVTPTTNVQAGTVLTYKVRFTNTGTSVAYDVTATDTLASTTAFTALTGCVNAVSAPVPSSATNNGATVDFAGNPAGSWDIPVSGFIECTYTVTAQSAIALQGSYTNTIDADWSSQDASPTGDRIYDDSTVRAVDGTQDTATATFTTGAPTFSKSDGATSQVAIGNQITYTLTITSPLGTIRNLVITDTLPIGLIYNTGSYTVNGIAAAPTFTVSAPNNGSAPVALKWTFGDTIITSSPVTIVYTATVANTTSNQQAVALTNDAALDHNNAANVPQAPILGSDGVVIVEPTLTIDKTVTPLSANVGDLVTFQMAVANTSAVTAHDVVVTDAIPAGLTYEAGTITNVSGPAGTPNDSAAPTLTWSFASIPAGQTAIVEFKARLNGSGGASVVNSAGVTWTSTAGANPNERSGADGPGGALNDYAATDSATLLTSSYIIDKRLVTPASGLAGVNDIVTFSITVTNTGATTLATIPLTDTYDTTYLGYQSATPASDDNTDDGLVNWANVGPLAPGAHTTILINFKTLAVTTSQPGGVTINRTGVSGAKDSNNTTLIPHTSSAPVAIGTPDMQISKTDGQISTTPGATATYTLSYANTGNIAATGVVLSETVPANSVFNPAGSAAGWVCAPNNNAGSTCTLAVGTVAAGGSGSATFAITVNTAIPAAVTQISNTATIADDGTHGPDLTPANNSATDTDTLIAAPDLTITKSDGGVTTTPAGVVAYTLTFTNTGNQDATGVVITDTVPVNSSFNAGASTATWSCADGSLAGTICTFNVGNMAVGTSNSVIFAITVNTPLSVGVTQVDNTASIGDDGTNGPDATPANNTGSDFTPLVNTPDLEITKSDQSLTATPGATVAYTLSYTNTGNIGASGVKITETVSANTNFNAAASTAGWVCTPSNGPGSVCTISVPNVVGGGGKASVTFAVTVDNPLPAGVTQLNNTASIGDDGTNGTDPTVANNTTTDVDTFVNAPDLRITKSDQSLTATPGATVAYTLSYTNTGNIGATGVVITETVSAYTTFNAGASDAGWTCAPTNGPGSVCTINVAGTVAGAGGKGSVTFAVTVDSTLPAGVTQLNNDASIGDDGTNGTEPTPANNITSDVDTLIAAPDLTITKSDGGVTIAPNGTVTYTLNYTNTGNQDATGVVLTETVPANTSFVPAKGWICTPDNNAGSTCTFTLVGLAAGASGSQTFVVTVTNPLPAGVKQLANTVTIADDGTNGADPTPANNVSSVNTPVTAGIDLVITKRADALTTAPNGVLIYTLTYTNTGNIGASGVVITEQVPANTTFKPTSSTAGWVCTPNGSAGSTCTLNIGVVAGGNGTGSVTFAVTVANPLPAGVIDIVNTVHIGDDGANGAEPTPANNTSGLTTPISAAPDLRLSKQANTTTTAPGAPIAYTLAFTNSGTIGATGVVITETVPLHTTYNATVSGTTIWSCANGSAPGTICTTAIPGVVAGAGGSGAVTFGLTVDPSMSPDSGEIDNTATIDNDGKNGPDPTAVNNVGAAKTPLSKATAISLASFTATRAAQGVAVRWETSAELNTFGFLLFRSADGTRANAVQITPQIISGQGRGQGGASYSWNDTGAISGGKYSYWLVEVEIDGKRTEYGPASVSARPAADDEHHVFVPFFMR